MNILFLMNPLETVIMDKDTSFILMMGAKRRGHRVFFLPPGGVTLQAGGGGQPKRKFWFQVTEVTPQQDPQRPFILGESVTLTDAQVDAVFIRTDPPFDEDYLMHTWLLDLLPERVKVINRPAGIRAVNEKIWLTRFADLIPPTIISRDKGVLRDFARQYKHVIAKPTDGFGGKSVFNLRMDDVNLNVALETLTGHGRKEIILQPFIPEAGKGDKRILLLNGDPLGAVLRVHGKDDHRNNFFAGGRPQSTTITPDDQVIIDALRPHLRALGLSFVGIDILGTYLIEVNVTSPTCLQEMNRLYQQRLEDQVIAFVEEDIG